MKQTIMIVEDSPRVLKFASCSLKNFGFTVITATEGMDVLEKISCSDFIVDMVITDLNMPNMDGYELMATLRPNEKFSETPIIILSSEEDETDKGKGTDAGGADSYLTKPFKSSVLLNQVSRFLS